jgi:alpha-L-fucosidase
MLYERVALKDYAKIADDFNPVNYDAEQWVKTAKNAGMKYIVLTTKHHEGFAMFDSKCSDYNIVSRTPFKRDPLKELADACHKEGIALGLYYSLGRDWEDPDVPTKDCWRSNIWDYRYESEKVLQRYLDRKVYPQIRELLTNYGDIAILWFDTEEMMTPEQSKALLEYVYSLQPNCIVNDRIGNEYGDFATKEQQLADAINPKPWEMCITMGNNWGYSVFDVYYKTPETLIRYFVDAVSKGGNVLMNVAPTGKGEFPVMSVPVFQAFNIWMETNSEAIYGIRPWRVFGENYKNFVQTETFDEDAYNKLPKEKVPDFRFTAKDNNVYIFARAIQERTYTIASIKSSDKIKKVSLLGSDKKVVWRQTGEGLEVTVPEISPATIPVYVLKAELK